MKMVKGPRPAPIHAFALTVSALGLASLLDDLLHIDDVVEILAFDIPSIAWNRDLAIVFSSALFTIVMIPVVAIWCFASNVARILMTVMMVPSALKLFGALWLTATRNVLAGEAIVSGSLLLIAVGLLYTKPASEWLSRPEGSGHET